MTWNWYVTLGFAALAIVAVGIAAYVALHVLLPLLTAIFPALTHLARRARRSPPTAI